ncbi:MAG: TonB-dependent receptor [Bacteroides sp.]|nr:TonB-dependent receptor [Bacteroides sp.]
MLRKTFDGLNSLYKPLCAAAILCSFLFAVPVQTYAGQPAGMETGQAQVTVKGKVVDASGEPIIGANIREVASSANGTISDIDGNFTLNVAQGATLEVSYIGYLTQQVKAARNLTVTLQEDNKTLDEVVVVGYGTVKKRDLTGAVSSVKSEDLKRMPTSNPIEAIQGMVAGLDITRSDGEAGSGVNMTLRGTRSINGSNTPLFIIDGMAGSYDELNPNDIASIEVLKDASSTAVYGAAGANGVVIITTKTPKKDKFSIDFDAYHGWNVITATPELRTGDEYIAFRREAQRTAGVWNSAADDSKLFPTTYQTLIDNGNWVDWFDLATQTGKTSSYNLSTSSATDRMTSYFSLNYYNLGGILEGDELERYSMRAKVDFKANDIVKYGINLYAMYSDNDKRSSRIYNRILGMAPLGIPYDENGNVVVDPTGNSDLNPLADTADGVYANNVKTLSVAPQAYLELTPLKGLTFKSVLGGYFRNVKQALFYGRNSYNDMEYGTQYAEIPNKFTYDYSWQNILTYDFKIKEDHQFTVTAVTEWTKSRHENVSARANDFDSNDYLYHSLSAATGTPSVSSEYKASQKMSYVGRINYNYKGKYLATFSARYDGSSMLAEGHKWDIFPAGAVAWRISNEAFMENTRDWMSNLKLRASYGVTGNAGASEYATMDYSRTGVFGFQDNQVNYSGYSQNIANKELGWEKSYMLDLGFDLGLFNDRINVTFDWYRTDTRDILYEKNLPFANGGYGSAAFKMWDNVCETRNTGLELTVTSHNFVKKDFTWDTTLSFATNKEEVVKTISDGPLQFKDYYLIEGEPIKTYYGYKYAGIWGTAEADEAAKYGQQPGQVHVAEKGEADYKLSTDDYQIIGNADPKWTGSLLNNFTFKNFDLSVLLIARWDWTMHHGITGWYRQEGLSATPVICDYWTPENQSARYPRPNANASDTYMDTANWFDGSYLKVKTISLGYTLPKSWLEKVNIERARIYFTASNPFIWTKCDYLKDYDPEKGGNDDTAPLTKQFVFGVNVSF